jgi:hypothetical protein
LFNFSHSASFLALSSFNCFKLIASPLFSSCWSSLFF